MPERITIGVDLGGTELKAVALSSDRVIHARRQIPTLSQRRGEALLEQVALTVQDLISEVEEPQSPHPVAAVGLAVPGVIDAEAGRVEFTVALTDDWNGFAVSPALASRIDIPVFLMNDAHAATVGEHQEGAGKGLRDFVNVTVGTGIGGGLVLDGQLYTGSRGMSGVLGHATVEPDGPRCDCGNRGCLETVASGTAITRAARVAVVAGRLEAPAELSDLSPKSITMLAARGNEVARELIEEAGRYIGIALSTIVCMLNPRAIVVGGGVSQAGDLLLQPIRREIAWRTKVFSEERGGVKVLQSQLGGNAGAIGAAAWAHQHVGQRSKGGTGRW